MNVKEFNEARKVLFESKAEKEARQFLGFMYNN